MLKSLRNATRLATAFAVIAMGSALNASASAASPIIEVRVCPPPAAVSDTEKCTTYQMTTSRDATSKSGMTAQAGVAAGALEVGKPAEGYGFSITAGMHDLKSDLMYVYYSGEQRAPMSVGSREARVTREGNLRMRVDDQVELDLMSAKITLKRTQ